VTSAAPAPALGLEEPGTPCTSLVPRVTRDRVNGLSHAGCQQPKRFAKHEHGDRLSLGARGFSEETLWPVLALWSVPSSEQKGIAHLLPSSAPAGRVSPLPERSPAQLSWLRSHHNSLLWCQASSELVARLSPTCGEGRAGGEWCFIPLPRPAPPMGLLDSAVGSVSQEFGVTFLVGLAERREAKGTRKIRGRWGVKRLHTSRLLYSQRG